MQARDFCYWLQGFFELQNGPVSMDERQVDLVRRHLNMVFIHEIDPSMPNPALDVAHTTPANPPAPVKPRTQSRVDGVIMKC